jgi:DNA polymerase-1
MECAGVKVDTDQLSALSVQFKSKIDEVSREIFELTGGEQFNIASPKQLSVVLFEKLKLQHFQKTQTGYSTNNDVLEKLKDAHPVVEKIITYRSYTKLLGTYIDGLRPLLKSNKVHTTFNQYLTTTGRLSSSEPNMQNIPIRDDLGKEIRRLFVSNNGQFVAADYSQIELRLLAGFSADENLLSAFKSGEDIHRKVAAEIFGVPAAMVTSAMRRTAKAVNFGIIYGQGAYGLSEGIGIPVYKAKQYIEMYFDRFPTIKTYLDGAIAAAKKQGYVTTFTGRRRYLPEINSSNHNLAAFGERAAMNMPLQGSAADIMKIAMLKVDEALRKEGLKSQIVLQIHDEVVVDCFDDEIEAVEKILKREMENAVDFNCPLTVEVERGGSLYEV